MKIIVVEDEESVQKDIVGLLSLMPDVEILHVISTVKEAVGILPKSEVQVVLLDIHLKDGTAFDILRQLQKVNFLPIFITAYNEYAIDAIKCGALDYLLKPIDPDELKVALQKANNELLHEQQIDWVTDAYKSKNTRIVIKNSDGIHFLMFEELIYCQSDGAYTSFVMSDGRNVLSSKGLKEYEKLLPAHSFIRSHQSYLVNKRFIKKITRDHFIELKNGALIPVSDRRREFVIKELV